MLAYEVFVNGSLSCLAEIDGSGALDATVHYGRGQNLDHLHLTVRGMPSPTREVLMWESANLRIGDELHLRIVDAAAVHEPEIQPPMTPERELEGSKACVRAMAAKWGWTLTENPKPL
jgi:hypothetical protein